MTKGRDLGKPVVVAGCVPQGAPQADYIKGLSIIGVQQIDRVVEVVEETLKGNCIACCDEMVNFFPDALENADILVFFRYMYCGVPGSPCLVIF